MHLIGRQLLAKKGSLYNYYGDIPYNFSLLLYRTQGATNEHTYLLAVTCTPFFCKQLTGKMKREGGGVTTLIAFSYPPFVTNFQEKEERGGVIDHIRQCNSEYCISGLQLKLPHPLSTTHYTHPGPSCTCIQAMQL